MQVKVHVNTGCHHSGHVIHTSLRTKNNNYNNQSNDNDDNDVDDEDDDDDDDDATEK